MNAEISRCLFQLYLLLLIHNVAAQGSLEVLLGGSVVLPCLGDSSTQNVFWRYNSKTVYDILKRKVDLREQDSAYSNRVESFPSEFTKGNFSIRLRDVKKTDEGDYICTIPNSPSHPPTTVKLLVKESRVQSTTVQPSSGVITWTVNLPVLLGHVLLCQSI